jgi:hypothetical protein
MPTQITSAGITFNDTTTLTSAVLAANSVGTTQITNGSVIASKLGTNEQKQICKAWVNFNGTTSPGTIRSSFNVSSVTKNGTGDYTVNFATAMTDANYCITGTTNRNVDPSNNSIGVKPGVSPTISSVRLTTGDYNSNQDTIQNSIAIFGN